MQISNQMAWWDLGPFIGGGGGGGGGGERRIGRRVMEERDGVGGREV